MINDQKNKFLKTFTRRGKFLMLALDHRGSFKKYVKASAPESATDVEVVVVKGQIIAALKSGFSGVLIDPDWGLPGYRAAKATKPFLLCLEKTGYVEAGGDRNTELGYTGAQIKKMGASGAKLLLYFNPAGKNLAHQLQIAKQAMAEAGKNDLPLFLEIVTYGNEELGKTRAQWVTESLEYLIKNGVKPEVWKLEYPGDARSCAAITKLCGATPWILLTRGETFSVFARQLQTAVRAGAIGFLAGRALWQEIAKYTDEKTRQKFLRETVRARFKKINEIVLGK